MAIIPLQSRLLAPLKIATRVNMLLASEETREEEDENSLRRRWDTRTLHVWRGPQEWRLHRQNSLRHKNNSASYAG